MTKDRAFQVMIVDDQSAFRHMVRTILQREHDFEVVAEAEDGSDAVVMIDNLALDLVLMDVQMPIMNGFEATRRMLERRPSLRVVLTSMNGDEEYERLACEAGAVLFIPKRELRAETIRKALSVA